jgi:hypothetical protein
MCIDSIKLRVARDFWLDQDDEQQATNWTEFMLRHGMHRPAFYQDGRYLSVSKMINSTRGSWKPYEVGVREKVALYDAYYSIEDAMAENNMDEDNWSEVLTAISKTPLTSNEVIGRYVGQLGKTILFLCDGDDYYNLAKNRTTLGYTAGYILVTPSPVETSRGLHVHFLDRHRATDDQVVDHRNGIRCDDRRRNLQLVSRSDNSRNVHGGKVTIIKNGNKYLFLTHINKIVMGISMDTYRLAELAHDFLLSHMAQAVEYQIEKGCKGAGISRWICDHEEFKDMIA